MRKKYFIIMMAMATWMLTTAGSCGGDSVSDDIEKEESKVPENKGEEDKKPTSPATAMVKDNFTVLEGVWHFYGEGKPCETYTFDNEGNLVIDATDGLGKPTKDIVKLIYDNETGMIHFKHNNGIYDHDMMQRKIYAGKDFILLYADKTDPNYNGGYMLIKDGVSFPAEPTNLSETLQKYRWESLDSENNVYYEEYAPREVFSNYFTIGTEKKVNGWWSLLGSTLYVYEREDNPNFRYEHDYEHTIVYADNEVLVRGYPDDLGDLKTLSTHDMEILFAKEKK